MARFCPRWFSPLLWSLLLLLAWPVDVLAAQFGPGAGAHAKARLYHRLEGSELRLAVEVRIDAGWHLYHVELGPKDAVGKPLKIEFEAPGVEFDLPWLPEPHRFEQPGLGDDGQDTWILGFEERLVLYGRGSVEDPALLSDPEDIRVVLKGLTCEDSGSCVPFEADTSSKGDGEDALFAAFPSDWSPAGKLAVGPGADRGLVVLAGSASPSDPGAAHAAPGTGNPERDDAFYAAFDFSHLKSLEQAESKGFFLFLLLAFVAGMILNVMPCVLPVISIKVLSFVQQAGEDKRRVFQLGLAFAAGILVVFWVLAAFAITANKSWGEQFQSATFLVVMIGVVFAFALSMFGVYELGVPAQVGQLAGARREGLGDAFFKGILATVLATPCSGPFLGSTLTWTLKQPPTTILAIFTSLGLGMALPYVLLTANPKLLKKLPRPGAWMDTFKQAMGFVLMATVVYLMISLEQRLLLYTVAFLLFVGLACWWYGRNATFDKSPAQRWAHLGLAVLIAAGGARLCFVEFRGLYEGHGTTGWERFEPDLMQASLAEGRSVFVDFTAAWCPNCKFNKVTVYDSEAVVDAMAAKGVLRLEADMTHDSPYTRMLERLRNQLGASSIPFMAIIPADQPSSAYVARDIVTKQQMLDLIAGLPAAP
jgi:thiol:disulfide interchange protein